MAGKELLKKTIYDAVMDDIIKGVYKQNEIINEKQLVEKHGVSKSPVRDALMELCSEGVLLNHPRYGYEVVKIDEKEIRDIISFRVILETACLRGIIGEIDDREIDELEAFAREECSREGEEINFLDHWYNNTKFHLKLMSYSGNDYCCQMLERSIRIMTRAYAQKNWERWGKTRALVGSENHMRIIASVRARDEEGAVESLKNDIAEFYDLLYSYGEKRLF